jgi:hypothetical protein
MTRLTEEELSTTLKRSVPEPEAVADRAGRARDLAQRLRTRRRVAAAAVTAAVALVIAVPTVVSTTRHNGPTAVPLARPTAGWTALDPCTGNACAPGAVVAAIRRPLRLPTPAPGAACPVSPTRTFKGGAGFSGPFTALGKAPLYLAGPASKPVALSSHDRGWRAQKVIWVVDRSYSGPLLLRGGRIDGPGDLRFSHYLGAVGYSGSGSGDTRHHAQLVYVRGGLNAPDQHILDSYPGDIYAKTGGCYAIQVDGVGFSETLVFRAVVP